MTTSYGPAAIWLVVVAAGVGTYAFRVSFVLLVGRLAAVPPRLVGVLRFVPAAVLAALVVPAVVALTVAPASGVGAETPFGVAAVPTFGVAADPAKVVAGAVAALVAWRTESVLATIGVGMGVLWAAQLVV